MTDYVLLLGTLVVIIVAAEIFTNALEHLGERLGISEGVTGSLFAAVATAMPESIIPLLALLAGTHEQHTNEEIGVGAILGAPLMLSTLSLFLMSLSILARRGAQGAFHPERSGLTRDLNFFLAAFALATVALYVPHTSPEVRGFLATCLVLSYFLYMMLTVRASAQLVADGHGTETHKDLFLCRMGLPDKMFTIAVQLLLGLGLLIGGAQGFIQGVVAVAAQTGVSVLLLSLLIIPVATELPEKVNSIIWIRRGKDTLAFGNITGAMVFQGTLLPSIGIMLTPWEPRNEVLAGLVITFLAAVWLRINLRAGLRVWHLWANGALYAIYLVVVLNGSSTSS